VRRRHSLVKRVVRKFFTVFLAAAAIGFATPAFAQRVGSSPAGPAPAGTPVQTIIECGEGYESHELYDVKITLLETVRGERAWELIKGAGVANLTPKEGFEYLLARVRFEYAARGRPGECGHYLKDEEFTAFSPNGLAYESAPVKTPGRGLNGTLHSGEAMEGWVAFSVPKTEPSILMSFGTKAGGAVVHGGDTWFRLY